MYRINTFALLGMIAAALLNASSVAQEESSRRTPRQPIEQDDIFDRLVPLAEATNPKPQVDTQPAPETTAATDDTPIIEEAATPAEPAIPIEAAEVATPPAVDDVALLIKSFEPVPTGAQWCEYFELDRIAKLLSSAKPLTQDQRSQMQLILPRFEKAATEPEFKKVAALPGFATTYRHLQAAVAVVPTEDIQPIDQGETADRAIPEGAAPTLRLLSETGLAFHRGSSDDEWKLLDGNATLASGDAIKINERGTARLAIGTHCEIVCSPNTALRVTQYVDEDQYLVTQLHSNSGDLKLVASAPADLSPDEERELAGERLVIVYKGHRIVADAGALELDFRHFADTNRVVAGVYAGTVRVHHDQTGDEVTIRAGREAVMLPAGIAVRAAAAKPLAWWPTRRANTAAENNNGFPTR